MNFAKQITFSLIWIALSTGCRNVEGVKTSEPCTGDAASSAMCLVEDKLEAPTNISANAISTTEIEITWTRDSYGTEAISYATTIVEYKKETETSYTQAAIVSEESYTLTGLTEDTVYNIRLKSLAGSEESEYSEIVTQSTQANGGGGGGGGDVRPLPQNLAATVSGVNKNLTWSWTNPANYPYIMNVTVQRKGSTQPDSDFANVAAVGITATSYSDTQQTTGPVVYRIWVNYNSGLLPAQSNTSNAVTAANLATPTGLTAPAGFYGAGVEYLDWADYTSAPYNVAGGYIGIRIEYTVFGGAAQYVNHASNISYKQFTPTGCSSGNTVEYRIKALAYNGASFDSNWTSPITVFCP